MLVFARLKGRTQRREKGKERCKKKGVQTVTTTTVASVLNEAAAIEARVNKIIRKRKVLSMRKIILDILSDGQPRSLRDFARPIGYKRAPEGLSRTWKSGLILRTRSPIIEQEFITHGKLGKLGSTTHARLYHLYLARPENSHSSSALKVNWKLGSGDLIRAPSLNRSNSTKENIVCDRVLQ